MTAPEDDIKHREDTDPCPDLAPQAIVKIDLWEWLKKAIIKIKERL